MNMFLPRHIVKQWNRQYIPLKCIELKMSQYGPQFIEPIVKPEKQRELEESGEKEKILHVPIKAALVNNTSSVFHDDILTQFTNYVMKGGQKRLARQLIERGLENIKRIQLERYHLADENEKDKIETNPMKVLHNAIENCRPVIQTTPVKRGGITYQVPVPVSEKRSYYLAMKWLIDAANDKERKIHFPSKIAWELLDASVNTGRVVKRKQDLHKQCEANRAYAHYRWS